MGGKIWDFGPVHGSYAVQAGGWCRYSTPHGGRQILQMPQGWIPPTKRAVEKMSIGGGFKYFYFHPYLGNVSNLTNIFQMG